MSDTPITDASTFYLNDDNFSPVVNQAVARQLERKLSEVTNILTATRRALETYEEVVTNMQKERDTLQARVDGLEKDRARFVQLARELFYCRIDQLGTTLSDRLVDLGDGLWRKAYEAIEDTVKGIQQPERKPNHEPGNPIQM